jgi:hypothetical protein
MINTPMKYLHCFAEHRLVFFEQPHPQQEQQEQTEKQAEMKERATKMVQAIGMMNADVAVYDGKQ